MVHPGSLPASQSNVSPCHIKRETSFTTSDLLNVSTTSSANFPTISPSSTMHLQPQPGLIANNIQYTAHSPLQSVSPTGLFRSRGISSLPYSTPQQQQQPQLPPSQSSLQSTPASSHFSSSSAAARYRNKVAMLPSYLLQSPPSSSPQATPQSSSNQQQSAMRSSHLYQTSDVTQFADTQPLRNAAEPSEGVFNAYISLRNVVASFQVKCYLSLKTIALSAQNVEYKRESGVSRQTSNPLLITSIDHFFCVEAYDEVEET